ncbi:ABC transporter ATP-binding protein [Chitinophaga nivalis]|uniref:ABC transporter ATP-binding protein/permease n=1 Tax=Chitinophaga nivalis TaxID=2991709 RepID=A0ABT3IQY9_9BACT|nr:ABC transporter ATP-binding protein [Chitinophaga nivalis]MCW3464135.1 ABC transporter ATP-binding protein/permease [Chitinophaga nivalis]MCW3486175.1 ABC transporter ATP-binding protein/permease [Chitinophaga nivalis]
MKQQTGNPSPPPAKPPGMLSLLRPYLGLVTLLIVFTLISNGLNLWIPKLIGEAIDSFNRGQFAYRPVIIAFTAAIFVILLFTYLQNIIQTYVSELVAKNIRSKISEKIASQSHAWVEQANPSRLLSNLTGDVEAIKMFVSQAIVLIISSIFTVIGACVLLLVLNWKLALAILIILPIIGVTFSIVLGKVQVLFLKSREVVDRLNRVINESILGSALIRVLHSQHLEYHKFLEANTEARNIGVAIVRLFAALVPAITFLASVAALTILVLGGHLVIDGQMTLGDYAAFDNYMALLIYPIVVIGFMSNLIAQANASYQRIREVLNMPDLPDTGDLIAPLRGDITFEDISVKYTERAVLNNLSFSLKAGTKTAVIGPTAAGKTQLLYLLTGLAKPTTGTVSIDGHPADAYNRENFYKQVGFVFQDSIIFNISIRENIAFREAVSEEDLQKAIDTAELTEYIAGLPDKLETLVSERGINLSGGQKQRIMLARALAINPKILLLDDFTARVDTKTERKILANIQANYPDITLLSVTQKISSVTHYDQIILLIEGEMLAYGTHQELINSSPEYIQIFNSQQSTSNYELQS